MHKIEEDGCLALNALVTEFVVAFRNSCSCLDLRKLSVHKAVHKERLEAGVSSEPWIGRAFVSVDLAIKVHWKLQVPSEPLVRPPG
eukprot:657696-Amphidinium_carterae.1